MKPVAILLSVLLFAAETSWPQSPLGKKLPVPKGQELKSGHAQLRELHDVNLERAKTNTAFRRELAETLLYHSEKNQLTAGGRYAFLEKSVALATSVGDAATAFQAVEQMDNYFQIDAVAKKTHVLQELINAKAEVNAFTEVVELLRREITEAVEKDDFELASRLGNLAERASMRTKNQPLVLQVRRERKGVAAAQKKFMTVAAHIKKLKVIPTDERANLMFGKYLCFHKGDWERGLFYLAQSKNMPLRLQAQRDLVAPDNVQRQIELGDDWWEIAKKHEDQVQIRLKQRAVYWYERVVYSLNGAEKQRLEKRIAAVPQPQFTRRFAWDHIGPPQLIRTLGRHNGNVYGVAFSPDGKLIASGGTGNRASIWDARSGKKMRDLVGHSGMIWSVAFGSNGKYVYTSSWDGTVKKWNTKTGREELRFPQTGRIADINGIAISPDGRRLMAGADDGQVRIWDVRSGKLLKQLQGHRGFVYGVAFSPDGKRALTGGSADRQLIYWDLKSGKKIRTLHVGGPIRTIAFSPDGRRAVAAGETVVRFWELKTGREIRRFAGHNGMIYGVVFSRDGRRLVTGAAGTNVIRYWDVNTGKLLHTFNAFGGAVYAVALSPGGGRVVSGAGDNTVRLWGLPRK